MDRHEESAEVRRRLRDNAALCGDVDGAEFWALSLESDEIQRKFDFWMRWYLFPIFFPIGMIATGKLLRKMGRISDRMQTLCLKSGAKVIAKIEAEPA